MTNNEFIRDDNNRALINNDVSGLQHYKLRRQKIKQQKNSVEERLAELERLVSILIKERDQCAQ